MGGHRARPSNWKRGRLHFGCRVRHKALCRYARSEFSLACGRVGGGPAGLCGLTLAKQRGHDLVYLLLEVGRRPGGRAGLGGAELRRRVDPFRRTGPEQLVELSRTRRNASPA